MKESFELKAIFQAVPSILFNAWLDSQEHSKMTGGEAQCSKEVGADFTAWDGYITGKNLSFIENSEIKQSWRTSEFAEGDEDSILVIRLAAVKEGTELTLIHTNIPEGQTQYKQGWVNHYFNPMQEYFKN